VRAPRKGTDAAAVASAAIDAARYAPDAMEDARPRRDVFEANEPEAPRAPPVNEAGDDRDTTHPGDRSVLIVENDLAFARVLLDAAREQGLKGIVTSQGTVALSLVHEYMPDAIILDINLPDIEGWRVLSRLKNDLAVRHTPVHVISTEEARERALASGARRFVAKPIKSRKAVDEVLAEISAYTGRGGRKVLLVEPDPVRLASIREYLSGLQDVDIINATDGARAGRLLRNGDLDLAIVNPETPELELDALMDEIREAEGATLPVIAYMRQPAASIGAASAGLHMPGVREVHSIERLLDQAVLALHIDVANLKEEHRRILDDIYGSTKVLAGKSVLIVDDDIRNIFALSSVLEDYGMRIVTADNGRDAIIEAQGRDFDVVLMDIMMPELDGLDTTREIRKIPQCRDIPIVAVTAKAMKGDRERCIEAGAWDYLSKPVDREQLLAVLRSWLQR
jgi:CheY-like chemotaxis protein